MQNGVSIIIPARNEEINLPLTIDNLILNFNAAPIMRIIPYNILIINDYSQDKTFQKIESLKKKFPNIIESYHNEFNPGFGNAIKTGIRHTKYTKFLLVMADGCDNPTDIIKFIQRSQKSEKCFFGSRYMQENLIRGMPILKKLSSYGFTIFNQLLFHFPLTDMTNAFKLYPTDYIRKQAIISEGFEILIELPLIIVKKSKLSWEEIPVSWTSSEELHIRFLLKRGLRYLRLRMIWSIKNLIIKRELKE